MVHLTLLFASISQSGIWGHFYPLCEKAFWRSLVLGVEKGAKSRRDPPRITACSIASLLIRCATKARGCAPSPCKAAKCLGDKTTSVSLPSFPTPLAPKVNLSHRECPIPDMAICFFYWLRWKGKNANPHVWKCSADWELKHTHLTLTFAMWGLLSPLSRWRNRRSEKWNNLPAGHITKTFTQLFLFHTHCSCSQDALGQSLLHI